jgi:hypothetical protein
MSVHYLDSLFKLLNWVAPHFYNQMKGLLFLSVLLSLIACAPGNKGEQTSTTDSTAADSTSAAALTTQNSIIEQIGSEPEEELPPTGPCGEIPNTDHDVIPDNQPDADDLDDPNAEPYINILLQKGIIDANTYNEVITESFLDAGNPGNPRKLKAVLIELQEPYINFQGQQVPDKFTKFPSLAVFDMTSGTKLIAFKRLEPYTPQDNDDEVDRSATLLTETLELTTDAHAVQMTRTTSAVQNIVNEAYNTSVDIYALVENKIVPIFTYNARSYQVVRGDGPGNEDESKTELTTGSLSKGRLCSITLKSTVERNYEEEGHSVMPPPESDGQYGFSEECGKYIKVKL